MTAHLSIRVAADTPPSSFYLSAPKHRGKRILPSPTIDRLGQWSLDFYEATSTFTLVTTRIFAHQPYADFVDGLQKATFPSPPAIQATWLPAFTMTGLSPVRLHCPSLGTPIVKNRPHSYIPIYKPFAFLKNTASHDILLAPVLQTGFAFQDYGQ